MNRTNYYNGSIDTVRIPEGSPGVLINISCVGKEYGSLLQSAESSAVEVATTCIVFQTIQKTEHVKKQTTYYYKNVKIISIYKFLYINIAISDGTVSVNITSIGDTLLCEALCNPRCQFSWTYAGSTDILTTGKFLRIF